MILIESNERSCTLETTHETASKQREGSAAYLQEAIDDGNGHVHGLLQQPKLNLDLDEPVNKDGTHISCNLPSIQIFLLNSLGSLQEQRKLYTAWHSSPILWSMACVANLKLAEILIDILDIFAAEHGIIIIICIHILNIKQNVRESLTQVI